MNPFYHWRYVSLLELGGMVRPGGNKHQAKSREMHFLLAAWLNRVYGSGAGNLFWGGL